MKIAYFIREDFSQLISPCYYNLLPEFEKKGHEITVMNASGKFSDYDCIKVSPKKFPDYPSGAINKLEFSKACRKEIEKKDFDLVFSSAPEYLYYLNDFKIPKISMVQDDWSERMKFTPWIGGISLSKSIPLPMKSKIRQLLDIKIQKKSIEKADGVIFVNKSFAAKHAAKNKAVIPNGADFGSLRKNTKEIKQIKEKFGKEIVLFLGRLELQKNPFLFARIAEQLEHKTGAKFLMIGEGEERKSLENFIKKRGIGNIAMLGWINGMQKSSFLHASKICVLPSLFDPFPVSMIEAMYAENALVASDVGGIKDAIIHNENGLLCKNNDIDSFRNSAKLLLNHSDEARRLAKNAKKSAEKNYSIKNIAKQYLNFFEKAIK